MKNWIWHQKFDTQEAQSVGSYYNISHEPDSAIFKSAFDDKGPFERSKEKEKQPIGFTHNGTTN